jgi:glycosyltransferase involved in cell wall biosynthesis
LAPQKDHASAFRAVAMLPSDKRVRLFVAGAGPDEEKLRALARELNLNVTFLGQRSDVPRLLFASDLFLFPTFFEGMSIALLEALAMGLPCLCSDIAENREVAADCAVYVPPGNPNELAEALKSLIGDEARRAELGRRGRERTLRLYDMKAAAVRLLDAMSSKVNFSAASGARKK